MSSPSSAPEAAPAQPQGAAEQETIERRFERISLEIAMLGRDARADIEKKRAELDAATRLSVDIEHAAAKLHDEARRARRHRVTGRVPAPLRPLGDGMV